MDGRRVTPPLIILLGALSAFSPLAIDMYLPAFPQIEHELAAPPGSLQLTLSLFLVGLAVGQYVIGPLSDRWGRRAPLLLGCGGFSVAAIACSLAPTVHTLMAARVVMGFCGASGLVVARAIVRDQCDTHESAKVYSWMMMVTGLAPVVAPILGSELLRVARWQAVFWVLSAFGATCGLATCLVLPETLPVERRVRLSYRSIIRRSGTMVIQPTFLGFALAIGFAAGALFAYVSDASSVLIEHYGVSARQFSRLFAINACGLFGAAQLNRKLLPTWGPRRLLRWSTRAAALASASLCLLHWSGTDQLTPFAVNLFVCVASMGFVFPNAIAAAMAPFAREAGAASAVLGLIQYAIGALAGTAVGLLHDGTAGPMVLVLAICSWCVAGVLAWATR